jgi:polyisoprenoid-binding protein YceI
MKTIYTSCVVIGMTLLAWAQLPPLSIYKIDPGRSRVEIDVFRGGLFKAFGHDHTVAAKNFSGAVQFDPRNAADSSVTLYIDATSLTVLDPLASEKERSEVQTTMQGPKVLNVQAFPRIAFHSTHVSELTQAGDGFESTLTGTLDLHGIEKESTFPVRIDFQKNLLHATGIVSIAQTDFGIVPINLGGGAVRVRDQVKVSFDILAERIIP